MCVSCNVTPTNYDCDDDDDDNNNNNNNNSKSV